MTKSTLTISSKNYASWSLRGWLLTKFAKLDCEELLVPPDNPEVRAEILLLSSSVLVPCLEYEGIKVWDILAIAEFLNEIRPHSGLLPDDRSARAHCRAICAPPSCVSVATSLPPIIGAMELGRPTSASACSTSLGAFRNTILSERMSSCVSAS